VKKSEQTVGDIPGIFPVYQQKDATGSHQDHHPLQHFEGGNRAEDLQRGSVLGFRCRDFAVHDRIH
jgi:hypothetical protein